MQLFLTVLIISILYGAEVDLFIPSFPEIQEAFHLSPFLVQLTLSANYISYAVCALFAGSLGDRYNRKTVILWSLLIFILGSICCVFAPHYAMLVLGRFMQGIGMAGPAVLAYVLLADEYPLEKQITLMGLLNGMVTIAMAFAPVVGSYVNLYLGWRANFVVLLALGLIALITSYIFIPNRNGDNTISLSPKTYMPLLSSTKLMLFVLSLSFVGISYWAFIGMAPILYMEGLGVELKHFGFYQGTIAFAFGIISIFSPKIIKYCGLKNSLYCSLAACFVISIVMTAIAFLRVKSPLLITAIMSLYGMAVVFPVSILFPVMLDVIANSKGRISALMNSFRLILTAVVLEIISYFYVGDFFLLGLFIVALILISLVMFRHILVNDWVQFDQAA